MSARVFKPIPLAEMHRIRTPPNVEVEGSHFCHLKEVQKVRRALFDIPDPDETQKFLKEEFAKLETSYREKWDFDFSTGRPSAARGRYEWTPVVEKTNANLPPRPAKHTPLLQETDGLYAPICTSSVSINPEDMEEEEEMTTTEPMEHTPSKEAPMRQKLITEFMHARKRIESGLQKKLDTSNTSRPKKIARMSLADSAS